MPDDPNRDIFPVKEGSCVDTCRSDIDPRERHFVCKLDRYQLEDRYLRLLDEVQGLKKLSNNQEDKIKRLATKLMRISANPRVCTTALDIVNDKNRISSLELENTKLKDKICVLKNQLLSHKALGRSPSRCRRLQTRTSSGPTTCRSENEHVKTPSCQSVVRNGSDDNDTQNYLVKIEELEAQKKEMASRITDLEDELSIHLTGNQREKVAENVEYIRLWRQLKQLNDKLIATQNLNDNLNAQINDLKKVLEETTKDNREITSALVTEKKRMAEMHEQMTKAKDSHLSLREKDEQIRDLMNEMKILQQHNSELIALSSKYTQVEIENVELKKRISEQLSNHQSLKSAFNNEQANIAALQAANEQLLTKLQELQKNMDSLTIQLKTFQSQNERHVRTTTGVQTSLKNVNKRINNQSSTMEDRSETLDNSCSSKNECCRKCCEEFHKKIASLEKSTNHAVPPLLKKNTDEGVQTEFENTYSIATAPDARIKSPVTIQSDIQHPPNPLSREKMLKLLEQAQINTPLEAQNAARIRQIDAACAMNFSGISETIQRQSKARIKNNARINEKPTKIGLDNISCDTQNTSLCEPNQILTILYEILGEYKKKCSKYDDNNIFIQQQSQCNDEKFFNQYVDHYEAQGTDQFNADLNPCPNIYDEHRSNLTIYDKLREISRPKIINTGEDNKANESLHKFKKTECTCTRNQKCIMNIDCNYKCCPSCSAERVTSYEKESTSFCSGMNSRPFNSVVKDIAPEIQKMFDTMYMARRRKNLMKHDAQNTQSYQTENSKNCENCMIYKADSFPMLITTGQGLVEIHILCLQLSTAAIQTLSRKYNLSDICLFVSWNILGQEKAFTPLMKYPKLNFNSSSVYRIAELFPFFDYVLLESVLFQVHIVNKNDNALTIGEARLCVKNILDYPQNKMHYIANVLSNLPCTHGMDFGQLSLWIRLSCDLDTVDAFKDQKDLLSQCENIHTPLTDPETEKESKRNDVTNSASVIYLKKEPTILNIPTNSGLVQKEDSPLESYLSISTHQIEPHSSVSNDRTAMEDEYDVTPNESRIAVKKSKNPNPVPTIPENPVSLSPEVTQEDEVEQIETSSIVEFNNVLKNNPGPYLERSNSALRDLSAVFEESNWHHYRKSFLATNTQTKDDDQYYDDGSIEDNTDFINNTEDTITIEIVSMTLFQNANLYNDPDIKVLYVEYFFLGYHGADMETISIPKPPIGNGPMFYNFKRKFEIDEKAHSVQREMLRAMLSEAANPNIRFVIVSEPLPEEMDTKECVDVGHANFNIKEYAMGDGFKEVPLVIMNTRQTEQIGVLKVAIDGIQVIRRCLAEELGK